MTSWFFIEMAAKSALICSIALLLAMALRRRAAADRSMVLRVGTLLLLALPLIDIAFPVLEIEAFAAPAVAEASLSPAEMERLLLLAAALPPAEASIWDDPLPLILILWAAGVIAVAGRLAAGLVTLRRWTRMAEPVTDQRWIEAMERARISSGASANLRLLVGDQVPGPLGWGWRRPVILIDYDTLAEPDEADAIMAHEVAHVARGDWPALMLTRLATALFWFNPLAWALAREAVQQAEEAADAHAARIVEPTRYAETLLTWGQIGRGIAVPANSIAPGARALSRRIRAVLDKSILERSAGSRLAFFAILLCVGIAAPVAALELVEAARPAQPAKPAAPALAAVAAPPAPAAPMAPAAPLAPSHPAAPAVPQAPEAPPAPEIGDVDLAPALAAMREVLPTIPHLVHNALQAVDTHEVVRLVRHSTATPVDAAELRAALEQARREMPDAEELRRHIQRIDPAELEARVRASMPDEAAIRARVRNSLPDEAAIRARVRAALAHQRTGMAQGAEGMERGAAKMEAQARRLRNHQERERIIERERERGRTVTHEDLLDAAEGLDQGAEGMREGARAMRHGVREMRGQH